LGRESLASVRGAKEEFNTPANTTSVVPRELAFKPMCLLV
jgi:hypothetical protein